MSVGPSSSEASKWECDPVALLAKGKPVRFLGMEIHLGEDGASFEVSQKGFIEDLLCAHGLLTPEEEEELLEETPPRRV